MTEELVERVARAICSSYWPSQWPAMQRETNWFDYRDAARAALAAIPLPEWRDIETAPIDEWVLLATTAEHVGQAIYGENEEAPQWRWAFQGYKERIHPNHTPLGWMPLPSPPKGVK